MTMPNRIHRVLVGLLPVCMAVLAGGQGQAQVGTGAIPPAAKRSDNSRQVTEDTVKNSVLAMPGVIMEGSAVLQHRMGVGGSAKALSDARLATSVLGNTMDGVRLLSAGVAGGSSGLVTEGVQVGIERAAGAVGDIGKTWAIRQAIAGGTSAVTASGGLGIAYTAGSLVGGWARDSEWLGGRVGLERTIGDEVDKRYWTYSPDWVKELASGTPQVDFDSPKFQADMAIDLQRRQRKLAFDRVQRENAEQAQQAARHAAAMAAAAPPVQGLPPPSGSSSGDAQLLGAFEQSLRQLQMSQRPPMSFAQPVTPPAQQCNIDPKTGCHVGHDEKSHPGGCKCGR